MSVIGSPFERLYPHLLRLQRPGRYLGHEMNALMLPWEDSSFRVVLLFPDTYELGMSNMGFQVLYHALARIPKVLVDRAYLPWPDAQDLMRQRGIPLFALESRRPLQEFDLVGITLQTELAVTNVLEALRLSQIPLLAEKRSENHPLVLGGGPCALNPAPVGPLFDALFMGEADEAIAEIVEVLVDTKGEPRHRRLEALGKVEGVFLPSSPKVVRRRVVSLAETPHPTRFLVSHTEVSHHRVPIEIMRGCDRGCRFCHAGFTSRPVRERPASQVWRVALEAIEATGHETISLLSLSTSDHSQIVPMVKGLVPLLKERMVTLSMPSLRAGSLTPELMEAMEGLRRSGFTIAPEAGSQRLRQVINKGITHQEIVDTARLAFENGWELVKLYFMMGLPTETESDLREMARVVREVMSVARKHAKRRGKVHVSVAPFVPKPHTPFQWEPQLYLEELEERVGFLRGVMPRGRAFNLDIHDPRQSFLEAIIARGDETVFGLVKAAHAAGCKMDQWHEWFDFGLWEETIDRCGIDVDGLIHSRLEKDHPFPWDTVDVGVSREFLWRERMQALEARETPRCRERCSGCGVCRGGTAPEVFTGNPPPVPKEPRPSGYPSHSATTRFRLLLRRMGESALIAQNSFTEFFVMVLRRSGVPLAYSQGYHPQAKLSFAFALPVGMESMGEPCELITVGELFEEEFPLREVNGHLPPGAEVVWVKRLDPGAPSLAKSVEAIRYRVEISSPPLRSLPGPEVLKEAVSHPLVEEVEVEDGGEGLALRFVTRGENGRFAKPYQLMKELLGLEEGEERLLRVVREEIVLGG